MVRKVPEGAGAQEARGAGVLAVPTPGFAQARWTFMQDAVLFGMDNQQDSPRGEREFDRRRDTACHAAMTRPHGRF